MKRQEEELKKQKEKKQTETVNNSSDDCSYYYECYIDGKTFDNEKQYLNHFNKKHKNDYPYYCNECNRGFYSYDAICQHSKAKGHKGY